MKKIALCGKLGAGKYALVDDDDFERVNLSNWYHDTTGYAWCKKYFGENNKKLIRKKIYMHRVVMGTPKGMVTDHINHDMLDNRKDNLRVCIHRENMCNNRQRVGRSGFRGVRLNGKNWMAIIHTAGSHICLGTYKTPKEAALVWNEAAKKYHGEFAVLNDV